MIKRKKKQSIRQRCRDIARLVEESTVGDLEELKEALSILDGSIEKIQELDMYGLAEFPCRQAPAEEYNPLDDWNFITQERLKKENRILTNEVMRLAGMGWQDMHDKLLSGPSS